MKTATSRLFLFAACVIACLSFAKTSHSYSTIKGHPELAEKALKLKKQLHAGDKLDNELTDNLIWLIKNGAVIEDEGNNGKNPLRHFYDPLTGKGLFGYYENAKDRATRYYNETVELYKKGDIQSQYAAWHRLGNVLHLLADMGAPSHATNSPHYLTTLIYTKFGVGYNYEGYVERNFDGGLNLNQYLDIDNKSLIDNWQNYKDIGSYMDALALESRKYYADNDIALLGIGAGSTLDWAYKRNAEKLLPQVISYSAGLINTFWDAVKEKEEEPEPEDPGHDHPDDTFDVSSIAADKSSLSEADLKAMNMRVDLKKGLSGFALADQFEKKYLALIGMPKDTPKETILAKYDELLQMGKKLEELPTNETQDTLAAPDIAVLKNGFHRDTQQIVYKSKETSRLVTASFNPEIVKTQPVLVIPSGGFYGMENSEFLKGSLAEYVKSGGTLIVMAQQHGYEFALLPTADGKPVTGYGWQEDQACFTNAVYFDIWHQMLSGQSKSTPTLNVDGYFTSYPENSTVMLRRTANGQPAMISYPYGSGLVIATTMFSDWAYGHGQASPEEVALVRDMISWAKKPAQLPEIKPGEIVSVQLAATNNSITAAASVKILVYSPDRSTLLSEQTVASAIAPGQSLVIPVSYMSVATSALGIYHVDYTLLDASGNTIQPPAETDSGRFLVSNPPKSGTFQRDIWFTMTTSSQSVLYGQPFDFTFHIYNNTNESKTMKIRLYFPHTGGGKNIVWDVVANPNAETTVEGSRYFIDREHMFETGHASLYDESGNVIGSYMLSFKGSYPSAMITTLADKKIMALMATKGQSIGVKTDIKNTTAQKTSWQGNVLITVTDPKNIKVFEENKKLTFAYGATQTIDTNYILPNDATLGTYTVKVDLKYLPSFPIDTEVPISSTRTTFDVIQSQVSATPLVKSTFSSGTTIIPFALSNIGKINVTSGRLDVVLKDPSGADVYSVSKSFTLDIGENKTLDIPVIIPSLKFAYYTLIFSQSDETRIGKPSSILLANPIAVDLSLDKPFYKIRETANIAVNLINSGSSNIENMTVTASIPDMGIADSKTLNLGQGQALPLLFTVSIPSNTTSGQHPVNVTIQLTSGSISPSSITLSVPSSSLNAPIGTVGLDGGKLSYSIENTGGIDTACDYSVFLRDSSGLSVYEETSSTVIQAGGIKPFSFNVPSGTLDGLYDFILEYKDKNTLKTGSTVRGVKISGVGATLFAATDKALYLSSETITGTAAISAQAKDVTGELNQKIIYKSPAVSEEKWETYTNPVSYTIPKLVDSRGAVWFAGTGILKYDGQKWQTFYKTNSGLPSNNIRSIVKDSQGVVWVVTTMGVVKYDGQSWTNFDTQGSGLSASSFTSIAFDKSGNIWFGTNSSGLLKFNGQTWTLYTTANGLPNNTVSGLHMDNNDVLWLISGGVVRFNGQTFTVYNITNSGLKSNSITKIARDGLNRIWVATSGGGISRFDGTNWTSYTTANSGIPYNGVYDITFDNSNSAWLATAGGVVKFNGVNWVSYTTSNCNILGNQTSGILVDNSNRVWVSHNGQSSNNGLSMFDGVNWKRYTNAGTLAHNYVQAINEDKNGNMWFATGYGLSKLSGNNTWTIYNSQNSCFGSDSFYDVKFEANNTMWVATSAGAVRYDGVNCQTFTAANSGIPNYVRSVTIEPNGTKWFIGYGSGVVSYDGNTWKTYNTSNSGLPSNTVQGISVDSSGNKWIASGGGLVKYDGASWTVYNTANSGIPSNSIEFVAVDKLDRVWVIVSAFPYHMVYQFDGQNWTAYNPSNSGLKANDIQYIAFDKDNVAWMGGSNSYLTWVTKFDGHNWTTYNSGNSGLLYPYIHPIFIDSKNNKWFANSYWYSTYMGGVNKFSDSKHAAVDEVVWENTESINQPANTSQNYSSNVGSLNVDGKLYLQAELKSSTGQTIASSEYPFYVIKGNIALMFRTDKKYYRPGDTITISGEVVNKGTSDASDLSIIIKKGGSSSIYSETATVAAGGSHAFTVTTNAEDVGKVDLSGILSQNGTILTTVAEQYEVVNPAISVTLTAPDIIGSDYFDLVLEFKNSGKVDATMQIAVNGLNITNVTVPAGEAKAVPFRQKITGDTVYTINLTGDVVQTFSKTVKSGLSASVVVMPLPVNVEGKAAVPLTITNMGLEGEYQVSYVVYSGATVVSSQSKTYYIQKGVSISDTVYFDLKAGNYTVTVSSNIQGFQSATLPVKVLKETDIMMTNTVGSQGDDGLIPVTVNISNKGYNTVNGTVRVALVNNQGVIVWSGEANIDDVKQLETGATTININPAGITPGDYTLKAILYNNSGQQLSVQSAQLTIKGATFELTQLPQSETFTAGQEGTMTFKVKNTGNQEGQVSLSLKVMDALDQTRMEWLKAGEEKEISFAFQLPEDLEEKDYFAEYKVGAYGNTPVQQGNVKFHAAGVNISVTASLDKLNYKEGETARLSIVVSGQGPVASEQNLFARVNYNGYEDQKVFTVGQGQAQPLQFDIPLTQITGEKLFYGIYHESGRSIHLNSLYVYKTGDAINILTDKQVYNPGETVTVGVNCGSPISGQMTLTGPGNYSETFAFSGSATKSITLPTVMTAGTYSITYELSTGGQSPPYRGSHPIDVNGIQVKVKEATLDKAKYAATDTLNLNLTIESNKDMSATLRTWVVDPSGTYTPAGETPVSLNSSEPLLTTGQWPLTTASMGIHRLVYGIYADGQPQETASTQLLLSSGSEAFDVGDAVLLGMAADKADYSTITEPVNISFSLYGSTTATIDLYVDGQSVKSETVALSGFATKTVSLEPAAFIPGSHTVKAVLTAGGLTSVKETSIVYGSNLPDLTITVGAGLKPAPTEHAIQITATVMNQGKTASGSTDVALYDGEPARGGVLFTSLSIPSLESGGSQTVSYDWNVMGKAGRHTIYAVADASKSVAEFNESNNTATIIDVEVPELILNVTTTSNAYEANQGVGIAETITNLTAGNKYSDAVLTTIIKDSAGSTITTLTNTIPAIAPGEASYANSWNTGSSRPGSYGITAEVDRSRVTPPVQGAAAFEILPTVSAYGDMTLSASEVIQGFSLDISCTLTNNGNVDIANGELKVEMKGKTTGISSTLITATLDYLAVLASKTASFAIEKVDAEHGEYTVSLVLTAGDKIINISSKDLTVKPPLKVTKGISTLPRVLMWTKPVVSGQGVVVSSEPTTNEKIAIDALTKLGAYYKVVHTDSEFMESMRSGYYNTYALLDTGRPTTDGLTSELVERVNGGDTLILTGSSTMDDIKISEVTGTKFTGYLPDGVRTVTIGLPFYEQTVNITIAGKIQKVTTTSTTAYAPGVVSDIYPSIIINGYGRGKGVLVAFDLGTSADNANDITTFSAMFGRIIGNTAPIETRLIPEGVAPVEITVESIGSAFDLKVVETTDNRMAILDAGLNGSINGINNTITWSAHIDSNQTVRYLYLSGLSQFRGSYATEAEVYYQNKGGYSLYNKYPLDIELAEGTAELQNNILNGINLLSVTKDKQGIKDGIVKSYMTLIARSSATRKDIDRDIHDLLKITEDLKKLSGETNQIRADLDKLLTIFQRRWMLAR